MIPTFLIDEDIRNWLKEDLPYWDVTTSLLTEKDAEGKIYSKQEGTVAGLFIVQRIYDFVGAEFKPLVEEGAEVEKKTPVASITGMFHSLLQAERVALNILGRLSGIATQTAKMVRIAKEGNPSLRICGTRKVVPGLSKYDKYAITVGGGDTHRFNLSDMVLLKENHLAGFGSITEAITTAKKKLVSVRKLKLKFKMKNKLLKRLKSVLT